MSSHRSSGSRSSHRAAKSGCFSCLSFDEDEEEVHCTSLPASQSATARQQSGASTSAPSVFTSRLRSSSGSAASTAGTGSVSNQSLHSGTPTSVLPMVIPDSGQDPLKGHPTYSKVCDLATGASGFVQLCLHNSTGHNVAIKFIERGSSSIKMCIREILNQRLCFMHPHIVQFHEVFLLHDYLAIVSEYAAGGDLADCIDKHKTANRGKALSESGARWLFQQLVVAIDFCHQMGIANRDIKLENTLLVNEGDRPVLKLCDFGYSKDEYMESCCKTMCGTPEYVAPEVLLYNKYEGKSADIWSCGVVLYVMLTGGFPFRRKEDEGLNTTKLLQRMFPRIIKADFPRPPSLSTMCLSLLDAMLTADPDNRISVQGIMAHPWFLEALPDEMLELNRRLLHSPADPVQTGQFCKQSEEQIMEICEAALEPAPDRQV